MSTSDEANSSCCNVKGSNNHQAQTIAQPEKSSLTSNRNRARASIHESRTTVAKHLKTDNTFIASASQQATIRAVRLYGRQHKRAFAEEAKHALTEINSAMTVAGLLYICTHETV
jgi:hypothetical protein